MEPWIQNLIAYVVGSYFGYRIAWHIAVNKVANRTLEMLEAGGYIKTKKVGNETEFIKVT
jgi:hypothetical protein|tara:strand:+ start:1156 stop:1335 length:180 start_codon:yes stop_codon:yes gene_type:complete